MQPYLYQEWFGEDGTDPIYDPVTDPSPSSVQVVGNEFTLTWINEAGEIVGYHLYYRSCGDDEWMTLSAGITSPRFTVNTTLLSHGEYEFAVRGVKDSGIETELHSSLDENAQPTGGWYLVWTAA